MSDIELVVGYSTLTAGKKELKAFSNSAQASAGVFTAAFSKVERQMASAAKYNTEYSTQWFAAQRRKMTMMAQSEVLAKKVAASEVAASKLVAAKAAEEAKEQERLNLKYIEGHRALVLYNKEKADLALAQQRGIISTKQEKIALAGLNRDMAAGIGIFSGLGKQAGNTRNKMNSTGMAFQQVGYQVGDFAVQVHSGQSAFVAFSQQATQLVGILPMVASQLGMTMKMAIGLSAGLGIGIPIMTTVVGTLWRMRDTTDDAADSLKTLEDRAKSAKDKIADLREEIRIYNAGFTVEAEMTLGDQIEAATEHLGNMKIALAEAELEAEKLYSTLEDIGSGVDVRTVPTQASGKNLAVELAKAAEDEARHQLDILQSLMQQNKLRESSKEAQDSFIQLLRERDALQQENFRSAREEIAAQEEANELKAIELQYGKESLEYLNEQQSIQRVLLEQRIEEERLTEGLANKLREALGVAQAFELVDMGVAIRAADVDTQNLISRLTEAVNLAAIMDTVNTGLQYGGRGQSEGAGASVADRFIMSSGGLNVSEPERTVNPTKVKSGGGSSRSSKADNQKTLLELEEFAIKTRELANEIGLEGEQLRMVADIREQLGDTEKNYSDIAIRESANRIVAYEMAQEALEKAQSAQEDLANDMSSTMGDAFSDWVDGTKSFKDAFRDMADDIIKQLFEILVVQRLVGNFEDSTGKGSGLAGLIGPLLGGLFADGAAFNKGSVVPFATGGVVSSATMFPMSGGKSGVMGEAGPEAIMPLTRGADGKLGVKASGGGPSGGTTISISVDARGAQVGVAEQIDAKLRVLAPKLVAQSVKSTKKSMTKTKAGWA